MTSPSARCRYGYLDAALAVVWKEGGIATSGPGGDTLERRVAGDLGGSVFPVHRLDRETAGWVAVARNRAAATACGKAFEAGNVRKVYAILIHDECGLSGEIDVSVDSKHAHTVYERQAVGKLPGGGRAAAVLAQPVTGRTHQLRIHFGAIGHGIVGDSRYADPGGEAWYRGHGLFLAAVGLKVPHPEGGRDVQCVAGLPKKFRRLRWWDACAAEARTLHLLNSPLP